MSKKYSTPTLQIVLLDTDDLIVTSPRLNSSQGSNTSNWNLGRDRDDEDWDDEE